VLVAIAVGGFAGSLARYEVGLAWSTPTDHFPAATFTINTSGAFLLGLFLAAAVERRNTGPYLRPFVATGLLGGWTTYSTLAVESVALVRAGHSPTAVAYVLVSLVAGLGAAAVGIALGRVRQADTASAATAGSLDDEGRPQ
jgi:CrcB protein